MKRENTRFLFTIDFLAEDGTRGKDTIKAPQDIMIKSVVEYANYYYGIDITGSRNHLFSFFDDSDFLDKLMDNDTFLEVLRNNYYSSEYYAEDLTCWLFEREMDKE